MIKAMIDVRDNQASLQDLASTILHEASRQGATAAEVSVNEDVGLEVGARNRELETVEFSHDRGFSITFYKGKRRGSATATTSNRSSIERTVEAAKNISDFTEEDDCAGLASPDDLASERKAGLDLELFNFWEITADGLEDLAVRCESAGLDYDSRIVNSDGARSYSYQSCRVYVNSHGFVGSRVGTRHGLSCALIAEDKSGMQRDYSYAVVRDPKNLDDALDLGRDAAKKTLSKLAPQKISTGKFPVIFSAEVASGLTAHLISALSGNSLYRKASFLTDSLGREVLSSHVSIFETPYLPGGFGSCSFDAEGVATGDKKFISDGVVASYVLSSYSGRRLGMKTTGNAGGVFNLQVSGLTRKKSEMVHDIGTGLLVTELMGQGVNLVTGDYSRGASGFWIEGGEIKFPVDELTIAGNLLDMYADIQCFGDKPDNRGNFLVPDVLIGSMTVAN
tara:strand:+ start:814 stop:2166 length:1353 start_codon:yes stop_codon:yes gene_type:complete